MSSVNCARPLHSGLKAPELVMDAGCRDNRCARDHQAVVLSCSHLASRWAALERRSAWLVVDAQVGVFQRNPQS